MVWFPIPQLQWEGVYQAYGGSFGWTPNTVQFTLNVTRLLETYYHERHDFISL